MMIQYSQASLQDFSDCKRRYYYKYLVKQSWPAIVTEPVMKTEERLKSGEKFHQLVRKQLSGVPVELLEPTANVNDELGLWWRNFLDIDFIDGGTELFPEKVLTTRVGENKLVGKFDLLAVYPDGRAVIYDWKTAQKQPNRSTLANRWQTIIYPYLLAASGGIVISGVDIAPEKITMMYWYTNYPDQTIEFSYNAESFEEDEKAIIATIEEIKSLDALEDFQLTTNETRCAFCVYRSLCDRGVHAGEEGELEFEASEEIVLDFDQIQEIEF